MKSDELERAAAHFRTAGALPRLWFFTDPARTPTPWRVADALPPGAAVVYRHFGARSRLAVARRLKAVCARRGLVFLVGADHALARRVEADGVHLPERMAGEARVLKRLRPGWLVTVAAHSARTVRAAAAADAIVLSAIYPSASLSAGAPMGPARGGRIARQAPGRVIALGGVRVRDARALATAGFAGMAGIEMFLD